MEDVFEQKITEFASSMFDRFKQLITKRTRPEPEPTAIVVSIYMFNSCIKMILN